MEVKLDNLIEKIRQEGIEEAREAADEILVTAKQEAESIVTKANEDAQQAVDEARCQATGFREDAEIALKNAARDVELLLKDRVSELFDRVLRGHISETLSPEFMKGLIVQIVSRWSADEEVEVVLSEDDGEKLEALLLSGLKEEVRNPITIRTSSRLSSGFRVGLKGEDVWYDFSDEAISEALKAQLTPRLRAILDG